MLESEENKTNGRSEELIKNPHDPRETRHLLADDVNSGALIVGDHTYGMPRIYPQWNNGKVIIGKYCSIAEGVTILAGGNHLIDWVTTFPFRAFQNKFSNGFAEDTAYPTSKGDVRIGNDVWIGLGATILSGVTIGDGAVIGAKSVISHDVPDYAIAVGNPAKIVKYRFLPDQIGALKKIGWWNWSDEEVNAALDLIHSDNIDGFINKYLKSQQSDVK